MKTVSEIRRENITMLADQLGRVVLAQKLGYPDTNYLNLIIGGHSNIGTANARKFERALSKPQGWLDTEPQEKHPRGAMGVINDAMEKWTPEQRERFWQMVSSIVRDFR